MNLRGSTQSPTTESPQVSPTLRLSTNPPLSASMPDHTDRDPFGCDSYKSEEEDGVDDESPIDEEIGGGDLEQVTGRRRLLGTVIKILDTRFAIG